MTRAQRINARQDKIWDTAKRLKYKPPGGYRIRRCNGNKSAWCLTGLREDGSEIDSNGGWTTALSLDSLLKYAGHLTPQPGDKVELVL